MVIGLKDVEIEDQEFQVAELGHDMEIIEEIYHSDNSIILSCNFYNRGINSGTTPRKCLLKLIKGDHEDLGIVQHELATTQFVWENTGANSGVAPDVYPKVLSVKYKGEVYRALLFKEIEGQTLATLLQDEIPIKDILNIFENLKNQLQVLTSIDVFQLDLNEGNILISDGKVKIIDYAYAFRKDPDGRIDTNFVGKEGFSLKELGQFNLALSDLSRYTPEFLYEAVVYSFTLLLLHALGIEHFISSNDVDLDNIDDESRSNAIMSLAKNSSAGIYISLDEFNTKVKDKLGGNIDSFALNSLYLYLYEYFQAYLTKNIHDRYVDDYEQNLLSDMDGLLEKFRSVIN